ncbi:MAG: hypothetical protein AVO35_12660 [Candidatus Aegiribacteria sp. MLS_C]|nr:MAG: hypothetical protein AVO35_12660 [Candidatus Aegiribacteria sp. MLS_C]
MRRSGSTMRRRLVRIFDRGRETIDQEGIRSALHRAGRTIGELERKGIPDVLRKIWEDVRDMYALLRDSLAGRYSVPFRTIAAIAVTLLYLANPLDLIPDFIPGVGYIDDVFIVTLCLRFIATDLQAYRRWRSKQEGAEGS